MKCVCFYMYSSLFCWKKQEHCKPFFIITPLNFCQTTSSFLLQPHLFLPGRQTPGSPSEKHLQVLLVLVADDEVSGMEVLTLCVTIQREHCSQQRAHVLREFLKSICNNVPAEKFQWLAVGQLDFPRATSL